MSAFDTAWDLIKATWDEDAYNAFMRGYGNVMRGREGLFSSVPNAIRGQDPYEQSDDEWKYLDDLGIIYNSNTGEAFKEKYLEDEDEYEQTQIRIPTPIGAGLEGKVFRIPRTDYVVKIPNQRQSNEIRIEGREQPPDRVMRSPLEAWWSQVLSHQYPVNPYSVFASPHPVSNDLSLNLVQPFVDEYHPRFEDEQKMNAIHQHLFDIKDILPQWDDMAYDMSDDLSVDEIRQLAEDYPLYEDTEIKGNMFGNILLDYMSEKPFIEDEFGGLLEQKEIDRLLEAALIEQQRVPKRYRRFGGDIDSRIQTIIDELMESQKKGRLVGSSINFADDRRNVGRTGFGRDLL